MAPSITSPKSGSAAPVERYLAKGKSINREGTPISSTEARAVDTKDDTQLAATFRNDLINIRSLVTCSICDQLLYEPFTLGCGHTYCYSCLCSWFVPNKRKKTCPECRSKVKHMPAPAFMIKQMVEIFTRRVELMPADESVEQHTKKRTEEIADVDRDKISPEGLFKGLFPEGGTDLWLDESDGVMRCRNCGHEHEGGPSCQNCGAELDDDGYSFSGIDDDDLEDLEDLELDLDAEFGSEVPGIQGLHGFHGLHHHFAHSHIHFHGPRIVHGSSMISGSDDENSAGSSEDDSGDDSDAGSSLQDFVVPDDESLIGRPRQESNSSNDHQQTPAIVISDDDSDEGGPVTTSRARRSGRAVRGSSSRNVQVHTVTDDSTNGSEAGELSNEADMLRHAGWSPLAQGDDSEVEGHGYSYPGGSEGSGDESNSNNESDTDTMIGNGATDDEEDHVRGFDRRSRTPTRYAPYIPFGAHPLGGDSEQDTDEEDSDAGNSSIMDGDGDTEMSASPRIDRELDSNGYAEYPMSNSSRGVSVSTDGFGDDMGNNAGYLGERFQWAKGEHESSDSSIQPPPRRQPRTFVNQQRPGRRQMADYDPRISMIFAEHQNMRVSQSNSLRGRVAHERDVSELEDTEPGPSASNSRGTEPIVVRQSAGHFRAQRTSSYRSSLQRHSDPLRSSRSPSVTRIISANRASRNPRQYVNTYHN